MSLENIFTYLSLIFVLAMFLSYCLSIYKKKAKPHVLSWLTWGILMGLGFFLSLFGGGGEGSWALGMEAALCFLVFIYALLKKEKDITRFDWLVFIVAIVITIFYVFTKNAAVSVFLAASIDALGFVPTFRKSYLKPFEEPAFSYACTFLGFSFALIVIQSYSFITLFYPLTLMATSGSFVVFLLIRRRQLARNRIKD